MVDANQEEQQPQAERSSQPRKWRTAVVGLLTFIGLVATTVASVSAALLIVNPQLKPREKLGASLDRISVEFDQPYVEYRTANGGTTDGMMQPILIGEACKCSLTPASWASKSGHIRSALLS